MNEQRPTHAYIGRLPCGCCMAVATDRGDADTYTFLAEEAKARDIKFERVEWALYHEISEEETFMACPHGQLSLFKEV